MIRHFFIAAFRNMAANRLLTAISIFGLAIGLALQGTLQNIAAGVMLLFLKPFRIGDFIDTGSVKSTVQEVGLFATELVWRPGARELLHDVRAAGVPTALVTSTSRRAVEVALDTLGRHNFDAVVCGDEVAFTKPHPDPYLRAAKLLGVEPSGCVAIEDSPAGVASALAAGARVIGVPNAVSLSPMTGLTLLTTLSGLTLAELAAPAV